MKARYLLFLLFLLNHAGARSQPYMHLPDSNAIWDIAEGGHGWNQGYNYFTKEHPEDTVINGKVFAKLFIRYFWYPGTSSYAGAFRSTDSGQTWFVPPDSTVELLFYDFSALKGDTVKNVACYGYHSYPFEYNDLIIDSTTILIIAGQNRKWMQFHANPYGESLIWIEGIGGDGGFVRNLTYSLNGGWLTCMSVNDTIWWSMAGPVGQVGECDTNAWVDNVEEISEKFASVYPNPAKDKLSVDFDQRTSGFLCITAITGQLIKMENIAAVSEVTISLKGLRPGMYLISIYGDDAVFHTRFIKE